MEVILLLMLFPPLAGAALNGILGRRFSNRTVSVIGCGAAGTSMVFALLAAFNMLQHAATADYFYHSYFTWIQSGSFTADFALYYDHLTLVMTCTVTVVAFLIHLYSRGYMEHEGGYYRFFTYLNLFLFMMLTLVTSANFLLMFVGWEGVGLCSYLLIGFYFPKKSASDAGKKAFIVTRIGDIGFTLGIALIFWTFGAVDYPTVFHLAAGMGPHEKEGIFTAICLLLFLGAAGKSAQLPLYVWLPDAMEGPTPVSALIHAATMVTAGVYLVSRASILFAHAPQALEVVSAIGCLTAFFAATIAICQNDLKRMLAYSTISQLGYMFVGCGVGEFAAGIFHLMTHAFFKSLLFLAAGSVMHGLSGELDMRKMGGLRHKMPTTHWTFLVATLAISGVPFFSGFFSKDQILAGAYLGPLGKPWLYWLATLTAGMTAFYMFRGLFMTFYGESRLDHEIEHHAHESSSKMTVPLMILAVFSVIGGYVGLPHPLEGLNNFLDPVFAPAQNILKAGLPPAGAGQFSETVLMGFSLGAAALGILLAWWLYLRSAKTPERIASSLRGLYELLVHKYYVDEIYNAVIVQPLKVGSEKVLWKGIDAGLIDGAVVNGSAARAMDVGGVLRLIQSGNIRSYAAWVLLGAVAWLGYILFFH